MLQSIRFEHSISIISLVFIFLKDVSNFFICSNFLIKLHQFVKSTAATIIKVSDWLILHLNCIFCVLEIQLHGLRPQLFLSFKLVENMYRHQRRMSHSFILESLKISNMPLVTFLRSHELSTVISDSTFLVE